MVFASGAEVDDVVEAFVGQIGEIAGSCGRRSRAGPPVRAAGQPDRRRA